MKKLLFCLLVVITMVLSACGAMDAEPVEDLGFNTTLTYDYSKGTFNNTSNQGYVSGVYNYNLEFFKMYEFLDERDQVSRNLTENEITAYQSFFSKLEALNQHTDALFELESSELKELLESNSIEVEALDIFTFNAIKNLFDEVSDVRVTVSTYDFIETILDRDLTDIESRGYDLLENIREEYYYHNYEPMPIASYEDTIEFIENYDEIDISDTSYLDLEAFFNILDVIKE